MNSLIPRQSKQLLLRRLIFVVTSEKNVESINKLVELIENKQFAQLSEAKLEFDDDPALRKLIRAEIGIDIALLDNVPYRQKVGDALEQRQKAVQQLDAGEIIIVDPAQPLLERDLSKIYIDSNGNPLSPEDAQKIQRLRKTQTAQFYLYTAGRANLAKADIAEAEALRDAGGISKAEFEERKKTQNKIIFQMQQLRKDVAVEIEERKTLRDINSGIMPIGFEDSSAQVQELGNKRTREVRELREVENNLAIAQARINEIKESGVLEQENKFLQEDARVELENLERSIPALAEGAWQRKKNLASLDTEILLIAGTYAADRPDAAAELALQGGLPEVALDSSNALEKIAPGKSAELQTEAAYASGVQEIAEQEISKQALSDYQREKVRFLLKQGDLATAVLTLQEMDPSIGGNAEENQKLAEELVWKELVDRADFEYNDRKDVAYHKHQQSLEERSGVGGFFTYFGRQISPINVYYLVTEGESKVIDTYDELDRNSIRRLSESEDQARALLVTLQALKAEGLTPQEAMERIRTLQIASPQARDAIAGETSTTFFHNLRNEMRGQYQTKDDIAMQAMEEVEKQITFNNGKVAPVEAQLRAITNEFPGTAASEQASRRLRELYRVEDLTFYNVLPTEALDTYGDAAMEVADITDVIPVGALLKVAKLAKGTKVAKVGSKLTTAVELSKWNKRIHFTSEARALEKVVGQARSELRLALKTGDTELIAAATKNLDEIKTAQQGLELSGSKLGNWWQNTALGKKRGITTAENVAYEGQRQAVKLLRDNIAEVGIKNVDQNLISGVQQANKVVEEATTFAARSNAVIDYTNEKVTPPTTLDSSVAKVDAFNSELVSQTHSIPKPVADDVVDNIDALDNAGAQLGPTLRYDPATLPSELQPRAAAVEKALDDLQVVARRAQQEAAAEAEFAASEFATSQRISGEARQQAVGSSADVLPEVHSSISTDLPAPRKRATAPGGPTEFTPPETIESGFNDAVSGTSRAVHSPEVPSRFLKQKQQFLAQPFDEDALADGVASAFIQYQKTGEFSPELNLLLNLLLSRLHGEPSEAAVGRVADKITSALQREGGPQLADTFQAYKDVVFGKGRFSVEYKPVYEIAGVTDEIRRYTIYDDPRGTFQVSDLNERVLKRRNGLAAQGIEEDKGGMRNMLNIMLEGEVRFGQTGPLVKGLPEWAAGPHGPYYVVLDESKRVFRTADDPLFRYSPVTFPEDAHVAYLVPLEADRELVSRALDEAVKKNLLTAAERDAILSKTITYDDYLRLPDEALQGPQELAAELKIGREPEPAELADMGRLDLSQANAVTPTERQVTAGRTLQSKITELEQAPVGSAVGRQAGDDLYAIATQDTHGALKLPVFENKLPSEYTLYEVSMDRGTLKGLNDRSYETGSAAISAQHQNLVAFAKQHNLPVTTLQKTTYIAVPKGIPLDENALLTAIGKAESSVSAAAGENVALRVGIADSAGGRLVETRLKTRRSLEFVSETGAAPVKYGDKIQGWYDDLPLEQKADVNDIFQGYDPRLQDEFDELDNLRAAGDGEAYRKKLSDLAVTDMQDANFKNIETVKAYQFNPGTAVQEGDLVIAYDGIELGAKNKEDILRLTEQGLPDDKLAALAGKRIDRSITEVNQRILDTYVDAVNNIKAVSATTLNQYSAIAQAAGWEAITNVDELRDFLQWEFANKGRFRGGDEGFATIRKVVVDANPNFAGNVRGVIRACGDPCGYEIRVGVKEVSAGEDYLSAIAKADEAVALSKKQGDIPVVISSAGEMKIVEEGIPEVSFIEVPVAGLESPQVPILHPQRAEEIFFNVEQKVGIELNPDARLYLYDVAEEINEKFLPNHGINSLEGAQAAFREGKLVSMKTLQQRGLVEAGDISLKKREKLGTADSVFISAKGPFGEFVDDTAPLIIFKKEMLGQPGVKFTPLDSGANYDTAEDIARGGLKDKNELDIYYNAYLRNRGRFQHLWEDPLFAKAEKSFYPEARFTGSVDIADNAEAILLTDENYKILIADPEISPEIKMLFVNVGDKSTTDAYYEFTGLDNYLDKDLDDLVEIASPANIQIAPCPLVGGAIMSPLFGNAVAAPCLPPTLPTKAITFPPQEVPTPKVVSKVQGYGPASNLYDRVSPENINEVFQNKLELLGPDIYGAKAVAYVHDDGSIQVVFLTESDKTHHRHALGTIIGGEKGELVYNGKYGDFLAADIADRSFGFEFQYDASKGKIIGIEHSSQITRVQFEKGKTGWKLSDSVVDTVEEQVLEKIDLDLFDESFIDKPFDEWTARNEIPVTS
ncbi:hypothetical protein J4228_03390 [Candidatus Woesearchaeota archaeon]|nr:hypothetical protein [Candidatus Woesearchaeota archaeon]